MAFSELDNFRDRMNKRGKIGDAIEIIAKESNTNISLIIDSLIGICINEQDSNELKYIYRGDKNGR